MGTWSVSHWLILLAIVLLVFGAGKIPQLMGDVAKGIKTFKQGMQDDDVAAKKEEPSGSPKPLEHGTAKSAAQEGTKTG